MHRSHFALPALMALSLLACASPSRSQQNASGTLPSATADSVRSRANASRAKGAATAPLTLIEISDFECPFCRQFFDSTYAQLDSAYVRTGKVRLVFITLPLPMHTNAYAAAEAALCAGAQNKFWPMHDLLFGTQRSWSGSESAAAHFATLATKLSLDQRAFADCVDRDVVAPLIINDVMQAAGAGVNGTPTFILNGQMLHGGVPFAQLRETIDAALAAPAPAPKSR